MDLIVIDISCNKGGCLFDTRRVRTYGMVQQLINLHIRTVPAPTLFRSINPPSASVSSHLTRASISDQTKSDYHHHNISIALEYSSTIQKSLHNTTCKVKNLQDQQSTYLRPHESIRPSYHPPHPIHPSTILPKPHLKQTSAYPYPNSNSIIIPLYLPNPAGKSTCQKKEKQKKQDMTHICPAYRE